MKKEGFPEEEYSDGVFEGLELKGGAVVSRKFYGCVFRGCDLTGTAFRSCRFRDCRFESCNLSLAKLDGSSFSSVSFRDSKLTGVDWAAASWPKIRLPAMLNFENCVLSDACFLGVPLRGSRIAGCLAKGADFQEADLSGADLSGTDLSGALFRGTELSGADLSAARNYAINPAANKVKGAKFSLPEALALLYCLDIKMV